MPRKTFLNWTIPAVREQKRGIVLGHERPAGSNLVPLRTKKFEESRPDFGCGHGRCGWPSIVAKYNDVIGSAQHGDRRWVTP